MVGSQESSSLLVALELSPLVMLIDLPIDLVRVILEHVSLKDIARLQLAASNHLYQASTSRY